MYTTGSKQVIPHYPLRQTTQDGNNLFEIREISAQFQHNSALFLPHRKGYYFFFLVKKGLNTHWIDFIHYPVRPGHLYMTLPGQIHLKERHLPVEGTLLAFSEEFLHIEGQPSWKQLPILQNKAEQHELPLSAQDMEFLDNLFASMLAEYRQHQDWKKSMLISYLRVALIYLSRRYTEVFPGGPAQVEDQSLIRRLKELLNEHYNSLHQVSDYARLLHVTPGHLNDTVRERLGRTATSLIHERIILEAKRTLYHTDLSVKEIGYALGFEDAAYFNRFFKRLTDETPTAFREKYHTLR